HARAALEQLANLPAVDTSRIAAIGYCFGGTGALELARSGANVKAVVVFHADLTSPTPEDDKRIKGRVLALHGAEDPIVPAAEREKFEKEMRDAHVDVRFTPESGHWLVPLRCPLCAKSRHRLSALRMSAQCQKATFVSGLCLASTP